jgi:insertion element IS1 protein InsB
VLPDEQHQAVSKGSGLTAHVERFNNTLRQRLARFVRKTLSFSKSEHMHLICLHRFLVRYNLEVIRD